MCYTASALSFMFENLGKSVVVTGSQIPICEVRSDGRENLIGSLIMAGNYDIPEVTVYFNSKLYRGNRTSKIDTSSMNAFKSANILPLATMKISINVNWETIFRSHGMDRFRFEPNLNPNIGLLRIFPSIPLECVICYGNVHFHSYRESVNSFLKPPIQGVILQTYGAGNIPSPVENGVIVVNCTQCFRGSVDKQYHTGEVLYSAGVISGEDMTVEASLAKLAYVLGKTELSLEEKKQMIRRNLRGEMTMNVDEQINLENYDILQRLSQFLHLSTANEMRRLKEILFPPLLCQAATDGDLDTLKSLKQHVSFSCNLTNERYKMKLIKKSL
ncbi:unnamed protein product [Soboliphyme baturini]|uniref:asparaginase n=1 Tax=Soboliphyme baturini TaxID=241478 RepID=A0A183J9A8_9BILA|nr:unnamed protein product [Soboliphyme baturini]